MAVAAPALAQQTTPVPASPGASASQATPQAPTAAPTPATPDATASPAQPTAPPTVVAPAVGVKVLDPQGVEVGTIKAIDGQYVTVTTAKGDAKVPVAGVGPGQNNAVIGASAATIEAAVAQAAAAQPAPATSTAKRAARRKR